MNTPASSSNIPVPVTSKKKSSATMSGDQRTVVAGNSSLYVKLNVGGSLHYTTIGTLTKKDNMLRAMFSGRMEVLTDSDGWILMDRCGRHFGTILNFLRDDSVVLPDSGKDVADLLAEAKFYCIPELVEACEAALQRREKAKEIERICYVPLITNREEEAALIASTRKPIVKLFVNRHNNKYSYTSTSDENLLKNIEQFDKLCQRFHGRIFFIKDVIGTNEICCWTFYGHGKKIAEVSCTSIVYATDKKHTKVDFPESRIYEETLNVLLYETRTGPEWDLMQVTSSRAPLPLNYNSDDDDEGATATSLTTALSSLSTVSTSAVGASGSSATFGPRRPTSTPSSGVAKFRSGKHSN